MLRPWLLEVEKARLSVCSGLGCCLQSLALPSLALETDVETECPGCRDGSVVKALFASLEDQGSVPSIRAVSGICHYL